jgi:predicted Zn-dependent protease
MKYGRDDELESDFYGIKYMHQAGYKPESMIRVMEVLAASGGGKRQNEFMSSHPSPENRIAKIKEAIANLK